MAFLRTLLWIAVTVIVVVFSLRNWFPVTINLFGDVQADVKLPILLLIAFLLGFVPLYLWHRIVRWQMGRRLSAAAQAASAPVVITPPPVATTSVVEPAQAD
jgi:lipopolysaccharide assembly protein A